MDPSGTLERAVGTSDGSGRTPNEIVGQHGEAAIGERFDALIAGIDNQSHLLNGKLEEIIQGIGNHAGLSNDKLSELIAGLDNQSRLIGDKLDMLIVGMNTQSQLLNEKLTRIAELLVPKS